MNKYLMPLIVMLVANLSVGIAQAGGNGSGGGDELVSDFVSLAHKLIEAQPFSEDLKKVLGNALTSVEIKSVGTLIDENRKVVANQENLVAYSYPGHIELKDASASDATDSWAARIHDRKPIAHQIVHELLRASGQAGPKGLFPDFTYQTSVGKYHLDEYKLLVAQNVSGFNCVAGYYYWSIGGGWTYKWMSDSAGKVDFSGSLNKKTNDISYNVSLQRDSAGNIQVWAELEIPAVATSGSGMSTSVSGVEFPDVRFGLDLSYDDPAKDQRGWMFFRGALLDCEPTY